MTPTRSESWWVGVDFGATKIHATLFDHRLSAHATARCRTEVDKGFRAVVRHMVKTV